MSQDFQEQSDTGKGKETDMVAPLDVRQTLSYLDSHYPTHYFRGANEETIKDLETELGGLRMVSGAGRQETMPPPVSSEYCQVGTDSFITNRPEKIAEALRSGQIKEVIGHRSEEEIRQLESYLRFKAERRYWGATDVRGCLLVVLVGSGENPALSAMHLESASVADRESFLEKMGYLTAPLRGEKEITVHLVGGYEAETSVATALAAVHELRQNFPSLRFGTVDIFGKEGGVRTPILDTHNPGQLASQVQE